MRVAICYDWLDSRGGAERILNILKSQFPKADFFSLVYNANCAVELEKSNVYVSALNRIKFSSITKSLIPLIGPILWRKFDLKGYELVLVISSDNAIHLNVPLDSKVQYLLLTPPRYLWTEAYRLKSKVVRAVIVLLGPFLRLQYFYCLKQKKISTISRESAKRFETYFGVKSDIIYPPIETLPCRQISMGQRKSYFLVVSRLVEYKRVDIVVEAFKILDLPLVIVGDGDKYHELRIKSGLKTEFIRRVSDVELVNYYKNAIAVIFPTYEDFGLVPLEAQFCGTPVVAYAKGGALETVIPGQTGLFFQEQTVEALVSCIKSCGEELESIRDYFARFRFLDMRRNAEKYSREAFLRKMLTTEP